MTIEATFTVLADMATSKYPKVKNHEKNCPKTGRNGGEAGRF